MAQKAATVDYDSNGISKNNANYLKTIEQLKAQRAAFNLAAQSSGSLQVAEMKVISGTEAFNNALAKQKVGLKEVIAQRAILKTSMREQIALQSAIGTSFTNAGPGSKGKMDLLVPTGNVSTLRTMKMELGYYNKILASVAQQTVNWGKNTQWAGRQITVGVGMPIAMLGAAAAAAAYQVDNQLTRIQKVYDTANYDYMTMADAQIAKDKELSQLRADSTQNAILMAKEYGASIKDTLETQADLAQTGLKGADLIKTTAEVTRISTLGELDRQEALQTSIALQNAFGLSADQMTEKFNFMNSVENATSLSIADIAEATPRAASALAGLGVSVEEMTVLLVAMREKGVDAAEGANALKSATTRILNPTRAAIAEFDKYNIDVVKIVQQEGGNLFNVLKQLSVEMKDLDPLQRQQAIARLFGTYQFNRLNAALGGIGDAMAGVGDATSQTARAMEVAEQSTQDWATTADNEIQSIQDSVSGKFRIAVQTLFAQLAVLGEPVLAAISPLINLVTSILEAFNGLPKGVKVFTLVALGITAVTGVALMLAGVFANLAGSVVRMGTNLASLVFRFKVLTPEQRAAEIAALRAKGAFEAEATSAVKLSQALAALSSTVMLPGTRTQITPMSAIGMQNVTGISKSVKDGRHRYDKGSTDAAGNNIAGRIVSDATLLTYQNAQKELQEINAETGKAEKGTRNWGKAIGGAVTSLTLAGLVVGQIAGGTDNVVSKMASVALTAGLIASFVPGAGWTKLGVLLVALRERGWAIAGAIKTAALSLITMLRNAGGLRGVVQVVWTALKGARLAIVGMLGPVGIAVAAFAAIAGAVKVIYDKMHESRKEAELMGNAGEGLAEVFGFTYVEPAQAEDGTKKADDARVQALKETNKETETWYNKIKAARTELEQTNLAIQLGFETINAGGAASDAANAVRTALLVAGFKGDELDEMVLEITARVNFEDQESRLRETGNQMYVALVSGLDQIDNKGFFESIFNISGASDVAKGEAQRAVDMFTGELEKASTDAEKTKVADIMLDQITNVSSSQFAKLRARFGKEFTELGVKSMADLQKMMNEFAAMTPEQQQGSSEAMKTVWFEAGTDVERFNDYQRELIRLFALSDDATAANAGSFKSFGAVLQAMGIRPLTTVAHAQERFNEKIKDAAFGYNEMSEAEKLHALNQWRAWAGLEEATSLQQGFTGQVKTATDAIEEQTGAISELAQVTKGELVDSFKNVMSGTMDDIYGEAERLRGQHESGILDNMRAQGEAEMDRMQAAADADAERYDARRDAMQEKNEAADKALSKRQEAETDKFNELWERNAENAKSAWDNRIDKEEERLDANLEKTKTTLNEQIDAQKAMYDARIAKIKESIEAEERAEDRRQQIFEAEKRRIERLAAMFNQNVDFNAALAGGNLDEAAKIQSDAAATQQQWSIDDQQEVSGDASKKIVEGLNSQIDSIEKQRDAATKIAEAQRDARIKTMEEEKDARIKNLNLERDAALKALESQKKLESERLKNRQENDSAALKSRQALELKSLENQKNSNARSHQYNRDKYKADLDASIVSKQAEFDNNARMLEAQLRTLKAATPRSREELNAHIEKVKGAYDRYGNGLELQGDEWGQYVGDALKNNVNDAAVAMRNEIGWKSVGQEITDEMASAFDITGPQLLEWLKTGNFPGGSNKGVDATVTSVIKAFKDASAAGNREGGPMASFHVGGSPGFSQKDRTGVPRSSSLYPSETMAIIKNDEYVVNSKATRKNKGLLNAINNGANPGMSTPMDDLNGQGGEFGFGPTMIAGAIANTLAKSVAQAVIGSASGRIAQIVGSMGTMTAGYTAAAAGKYGGSNFSAEQLQNAATIMNVGRGMGASERDLIIALMTAMQESTLKNLNYGDRDSVGLFQQRTSQGWGSISQIMDPQYSSRKFFEGLLKVDDRDSMPLWKAAQTVQRSGHPTAYAKWEDEARAILNGSKLGFTLNPMDSPVAAGGGWNKPLRSKYKISSPFGMRLHPISGRMKLHSGIDLAAPEATPIYATKAGQVVSSGYAGSLGNYVKLSHGNNTFSGYGHMYRTPLVRVGEYVKAGQKLGGVGTTGGSTGDHLHFQIGTPNWVNPKKIMPSLRSGGEIKFDNTIANLHKDEAVLTAPLTRDLKEGIKNIDSSSSNRYDVTINLNGPVSSNVDVEKAVYAAIDKKQGRLGRARVVR